MVVPPEAFHQEAFGLLPASKIASSVKTSLPLMTPV